MADLFEDIIEFHEKFKLDRLDKPGPLNKELDDLRWDRLVEEMKELLVAKKAKDMEGQFDALIDIVYIALGTAYLHGLDFNAGWKRVHKANMKKQRVENIKDSRHKNSFDIIKPKGWHSPKLKDLV